jgi:hypothetical protein
MKTIILTLVLTNISFAYSQSNDDCGCNVALVKDIIQSKSSYTKRYRALETINDRDWELIKKENEGSGEFEVFGLFSIGGGASYTEFSQRRREFFRQKNHEENIAQAHEESNVVTNPIAYHYWSECKRNCSIKNGTELLKFVSEANENDFLLNLRYIKGANENIAPNFISLKVQIENGTFDDKSTEQTIDLNHGSIKQLSIKRDNRTLFTKIKLHYGNGTIEELRNRYRIPVVLRYTDISNPIYIGNTKAYDFPSPDLEGVSWGSEKCKFEGAKRRGDECWVENILKLDTLPIGYFYDGPFSMECLEGASNPTYQRINSRGNTKQRFNYNKSRIASVTWETSFSPLTWRIIGNIYQGRVIEKELVEDNGKFPIKLTSEMRDVVIMVAFPNYGIETVDVGKSTNRIKISSRSTNTIVYELN